MIAVIKEWLRRIFAPSEPTKIEKSEHTRCDGWQRHKAAEKRKRRRRK